ncbi:MAG: hypothetical protein HS117_19440 [Verrucomicrobiaceae bacterium]|nr:hypothetical protein [Verrucomicrobiaceae bacterium]
MKSLLYFLSSLFSLLCLANCAAFTKRDAMDTGMMIARASINLAAQKAAGEKVDLKEAGRQLGFQVVSSVSTAMQSNLSADNKPLAAATVLAAGEAAKLLITETPFDSPEAQAAALRVASVAVDAAAQHFNGPLAVPSGK